MAQPSNRENLVKGAIRCLLAKGYARTTARDIAAASEANLASIGYHFGSKESLLNEALIRIFERRNRQVGKLAASSRADAGPLGFLGATFAAAGEVFKAPRPVFVALLEAVAQAEYSGDLRDQLAEHYREARARIASTVAANVGGENPEAMASFLLAVFDGLVIQWLLDPQNTPTTTAVFDALVATMEMALDTERSAGRTPRRPARKTRRSRPAVLAER